MLTLIFFLLLLSSVLHAQIPEIIHMPPEKYSRSFFLRLDALFSSDPALVDEGFVLIRAAGSSHFQEYVMDFDGLTWSLQIPGEELPEGGLEYLILFRLENSGVVSFPSADPFNSPQKIEFSRAAAPMDGGESRNSAAETAPRGGTLDSDILILSPEPGARVPADDLVITLSLFNTPDADLNTVKVFLNGRNISAEALLSPEIITVAPSTARLKAGTQTVEVQVSNNLGIPFTPISWSFDLVAEAVSTEKIFDVSGRVAVDYRNERLENTQNNLFRTRLNLNGAASKVNYGIDLNMVDNEDPRFQPRSTYSFFISSDYLDLDIGDAYPLFTRNSLWGSRVRGVHANVKFGLFNVQVVRGQSIRKVLGDYEYDQETQVWSLNKYSYGRNVFGVKPSLGNVEKFNVYLGFIQTRDDTASIFPPEFLPGYDALNHSYSLKGVKPQDNLILSTGSTLYLDNRKLSWFQDLSISLSNSDISGGAIDEVAFGDTTIAFSEVMDALGLGLSTETLAPLFIINANTGIPIPMGLTKDLEVEIAPTEFSRYPSMAYFSLLTLDYYGHYVNLQYRRVAPEYRALAHSGIMSDNKGLEINDRIRLLNNRLFLNLGFIRQRDNLIEGVKQFTSESRTTSVGLNLMPGPNFPTANITMRVHNRSNNATEVDTLISSGNLGDPADISYTYNDPRVSNQSSSQTVNISQPLQFLGLRHSLNVSYVRSDRRDLILLRPPGFNDVSMDMQALTLTGITRYGNRVIQTLNYSRSSNRNAGSAEYNYEIGGARMDFKLFRNALQNSWQMKLTRAYGLIQFNQLSLGSDLKINIYKNDLQFSVLFNKITQDIKEVKTLKLFVKYSYSF